MFIFIHNSRNSNTVNCQQVQFNISAVSCAGYSFTSILSNYNLKTSTATDTVWTNKTLATLFGNKHIKAVILLYANGSVIPRETIVWPSTEQITVGVYNVQSAAASVTVVRLAVFYTN